MGFWNIVQETLMIACAIIGGIFAVCIGFGVLEALMWWLFFLLQYPMGFMFWVLEKMLPPSKSEHIHRRKPEPPPPPPSMMDKRMSEEYER